MIWKSILNDIVITEVEGFHVPTVMYIQNSDWCNINGLIFLLFLIIKDGRFIIEYVLMQIRQKLFILKVVWL